MNQKAYIRMLTRTETNPLSFNEWLVYSHLYRHKQERTGVELAEVTGLNKNTLTSIKTSLAGRGLLEGNKFCVRTDPPEGWFVPRPEGRLAYWKYYLLTADNPLKALTNAVLSLILSYGKVISQLALAKQLGIDPQTARKAIVELEELGLLERRKPKPENIPTEWHRERRPKRDLSKMTPAEKAAYLFDRFCKSYGTEEYRFTNEPYLDGKTFLDLARDKILLWIKVAVACHWKAPVINKELGKLMRLAMKYGRWDAVAGIFDAAAEVLCECLGKPKADVPPQKIAATSLGTWWRKWGQNESHLRKKDNIDWKNMGRF